MDAVSPLLSSSLAFSKLANDRVLFLNSCPTLGRALVCAFLFISYPYGFFFCFYSVMSETPGNVGGSEG